MKIVFFLGSSNPYPGAGWTRIEHLAQTSIRARHEVVVIGTFSLRSLFKAGTSRRKGICLMNLCPTIEVSGLLSLILNTFLSLLTVPLLTVVQRPDVLVVSVPNGEPAIGAYLGAQLIRGRVFTDYRDEWEDCAIQSSRSRIFKSFYGVYKEFMTGMYRRSEWVTAVTSPLAGCLRRRGLRNVVVFTNGADALRFKPFDRTIARSELGLAYDDFIVVYDGGVGGYYRLGVAVRALALLLREVSSARLLIVGQGPDLNSVRQLGSTLSIQDRITIVGPKMTGTEIATVLSASDLGLIPYDNNPLWKNAVPSKFYEYCSCGLPVVATVSENSVLQEIIDSNGIGIVVPPLDADLLCAALKTLYHDKSLRSRSGGNARRLILASYDRNTISREYLRLIEGAVL